MIRVIYSLFFGLMLSALSACSAHVDSDKLFSIEVKSTIPIDGEPLSDLKRQLEQAGPEMEVRRVVGDIWMSRFSNAQASALHIAKVTPRVGGEQTYNIIMVFDAIPDDDSVSSYRYDLQLSEAPSGLEIVKLEESWRCWPGRGHQYFSVDACT